MENMIAQMAYKLGAMGFSIDICALTFADSFRSRLPDNVRVFELQRRRGIDFACILSLRALVKNLRPCIVHSHNWNGLFYSVAALVGTATPLVHGEHAELYEWERVRWRLKLRKALYSRCDLVHTVSRGQVTELNDLGVAHDSDLKVICNGVDSEIFRPMDKGMARELLCIPPDGRFIGMVARFVPEKRHQLMLEAFRRLGDVFPDLNLIIAGGGGACEESTRLMVENHRFRERIYWLGSNHRMVTIYNALDLVVLPSTAEGMSNVCLEAMSCGIPVLRHQLGGLDELIEDGCNGFVRNLNDCVTLVDSIAGILRAPDMMTACGLNARSAVELGYRLETTAENYASLYIHAAGSQLTH
jgi:glycosyltransferase involved in cell wall biosynthesis